MVLQFSLLSICLNLCTEYVLHVAGIVINNKRFTCGMKDRVGTDRDAEALSKLFINLGFYTNRYDNLRGKDMKRKLKVRQVCVCCYSDTMYTSVYRTRLI